MKTRIVTGVVAGALFITFLLLGGYWFAGLVLGLAVVGLGEYLRMYKLRNHFPLFVIGFIFMVTFVFMANTELFSGKLGLIGLVWLLLFVLLVTTVATKNKTTIDQISSVFAGAVYIGLGFHYMIYSRNLEPNGLFWTLLIFVCIWASDSGAYFAGRAFGKRLLWPTISPNKTIEGALGGIVLAIIAALCFSWAKPELLPLGNAIYLGAVIAVVGQLGDLIQSAYKRVKGIKDTGNILPGHGGVLDRVDSWLIVFPFVHLLSLIPI
ncbi:phosphatidate cytidylyltransferase [Paenibacillus sp. J2TS4]|uniref:phosphatidate cytidylyltransferase n=1 Tax=Paenibacillus sp. J2TS4 TaxID=2807194 RepID=UPI001B2AF35D|nr:phosphatidate cytidylyltransferase [Paenibacillus sp. J2TS4]GIP33103.1 phosphatidate cytidylyltransferase [Paenibacillus sp. J2TS4]